MNNADDTSSILINFSPWIKDSPEQYEKFFNLTDYTEYKKRHIFYSQEEDSNYVYLIHKGRVGLFMDNMNGNTKGTFIADKGFIFGKLSIFDNLPNCCYATVISDSAQVYKIPKAEFSHLLDTNLEFNKLIMKMMAKTIRALIVQVRLASFNNSRAKVCYYLYHLLNTYSNKQPDGYKINITFTHQEIAEMIGISRVSVSNILSDMVKDDILIKKQGYYYVHNPEAIKEHIFDEITYSL